MKKVLVMVEVYYDAKSGESSAAVKAHLQRNISELFKKNFKRQITGIGECKIEVAEDVIIEVSTAAGDRCYYVSAPQLLIVLGLHQPSGVADFLEKNCCVVNLITNPNIDFCLDGDADIGERDNPYWRDHFKTVKTAIKKYLGLTDTEGEKLDKDSIRSALEEKKKELARLEALLAKEV